MTSTQFDSHADEDEIFAEALKLFNRTGSRIGKIYVSGHPYWTKWSGYQSWLNRLQKGSAQAAFDRELAALDIMNAHKAPVAVEVLRTNNLIVFQDAGPTLEQILRHQIIDESECVLALEKTALAIASLHKSGHSHGRPILRDICWDGEKITFLDFENFREARNNPKGHARDLVWFVFSMYAQCNSKMPAIDAAVSAYRAADTMGVWDIAVQWAHRNRWFDWLSRPIQLRPDPHAREFKAIPMTLDHFTNRRSEFPVQANSDGF